MILSPLSVALFLIVVTFVFHFALRNQLGEINVIWIKIEFTWMALTAVALMLFVFQTDNRATELLARYYKDQFPDSLSDFRDRAKNILNASRQARSDWSLVFPRSYDISADRVVFHSNGLIISSRFENILRRISETSNTSIEALVNLERTMEPYCLGALSIQSMGDDLRKKVDLLPTDNEIGNDQAAYSDVVTLCDDSIELQARSRAVTSASYQSIKSSLSYNLPFIWPYILSVGIALKITKVTSDYIQFRRRLAQTVLPTDVKGM